MSQGLPIPVTGGLCHFDDTMGGITSFVESTREECWTCEAKDPAGFALKFHLTKPTGNLVFVREHIPVMSLRIWDAWRSRGSPLISPLMLEVLTYEQNPRDILAIRGKVLVCRFVLEENR